MHASRRPVQPSLTQCLGPRRETPDRLTARWSSPRGMSAAPQPSTSERRREGFGSVGHGGNSDLATLGRDSLDVLVIGGGVVGTGVALDAATRGLSVGVVEAQDWASGSSSRATKLIHGGLRYLQMLDFYLVREALNERSLLLDYLAPHLVSKVRFLFPLRHRLYERAVTAAGIFVYDSLSWKRGGAGSVPRQHQLSMRRMYNTSPGLREGTFIGGIEYYDAQVDDARYVVTLLRSAVEFGAMAVSRSAAVGLQREGANVVGARLRDLETGTEFVARARSVILATGVWTGEVAGLAGNPNALKLRPSKGVHLVIARAKIELSSAIVSRTATSVLFIIPWGEHWIIGTTDTPWNFDKARPVANASDISYLLEQANSILSKPLAREDVETVWAGLRPLIAAGSSETTKISREHAVAVPADGLVEITGGKYTTYRIMARDAVDAAVSTWSEVVGPSVTESIQLVGASGIAAYRNRRGQLATSYGLTTAQIDHLLGRYGTLIDTVLEPGLGDASLLRPLAGATNYLRAEVRYAVTHEGALHADDVLRRRLRLDSETADRGIASLEEVVSIMADVLSWSGARRREEVACYRELVDAELLAERQPGDGEASRVMNSLSTPLWSDSTRHEPLEPSFE